MRNGYHIRHARGKTTSRLLGGTVLKPTIWRRISTRTTFAPTAGKAVTVNRTVTIPRRR